jgi:GTP cyclohydrolase I
MQVTFTEEQHDELVLVKDIPFYSMCEHHFVPFMGKAHVGYIPQDGSVVGLSKLARVVEEIAKRPQLQERITSEVANIIMEEINPRGVIVVIEAEHLCMSMRGVKKPGSKTVTSAVRGIFKSNSKSRSEAMSLINNK